MQLTPNCAQNLHLLETLFSYSPPKETARFKILQLICGYPRHERPSKIRDIEGEIEKSAAIAAIAAVVTVPPAQPASERRNAAGWPGQTCAQRVALGAAVVVARPAELDRLSWLAVGKSVWPAATSLPLQSCLNDPPAGAAPPATELAWTLITN